MKSQWADIATRLLRARGPMEMYAAGKAVARASSQPERGDEIARWLFWVASKGQFGLRVVESPRFRLNRRRSHPILPRMGWVRSAYDALSASSVPLSLLDLLAEIRRTANFRFNNAETGSPEWQLLHNLSDEPNLFGVSGRVVIGVNTTAAIAPPAPFRESAAKPKNFQNLHESNLEAAIAENLNQIENGLTLVQQQYSAPPVGRIDLLCRDRKGRYVVIELKRFGANSQSVIDQVTRYMGWVKDHLAAGGIVRGIVIVGSEDERLAYSARAIPNLEMKCFAISLRDFGRH